MWIMTTEGFYSIVAHRNNSGWLLVRARAREDLVRLLARIDLNEAKKEVHGKITVKTPSDYQFRVWVDRQALSLVFADIVEDIPYDNFKTAVGRVDSARSSIYHSVWSTLCRISGGTNYGYDSGYTREWDSWPVTRPATRKATRLFDQARPDDGAPVEELFDRLDSLGSGELDEDVGAIAAAQERRELPEERKLRESLTRHHGITGIGDVAESQRRLLPRFRKKDQ